MAGETLSWSLGFRNAAGRYLTAETFGNRINASGTSLKKKQIFTLEQDAGSSKVSFRSSLNKYLSAEAGGAVKGESDSKAANEMFEIEAQADGKWAIKSSHGFYLGGDGDNITAYTKTIAADRLWTVQLAMHPQVVLRNVNRKKYVHLNKDRLAVEELIPWGDDALVTLKFFEDGSYGLEASNGQYLSAAGPLKAEADASCKFALVFLGGLMAFKASDGRFLTAVGSNGLLQATKEGSIGPDEQFNLEDCHPQFTLVAPNGKLVSVKTGAPTANQEDKNDSEVFQMEMDKTTKKWSLRTHKNTFWSVGADGSISGDTSKRGDTEWFDAEWLNGKLALRASNGKYVSMKKNGSLSASAGGVADDSTFTFAIINRPRLVLRGEHGFLATTPEGVHCNKSNPEVYNMQVAANGQVAISSKGKYWKVEKTGTVTLTGTEPEYYSLEFVEHTKLAIKIGDKYLQGQQSGGFTATGTKIDASTLWEY